MAERTHDNELYDNHGELELAGSANAYTATTARAITGYFKGLRICGKANHTNTGASTLAVNGLPAAAIRKNASVALVAGNIISGQYYDFLYDATNGWFQIAGLQDAREALAANRTYYVRTDGSDSNTGLVDSAGGAFLTIQKAYNVIADTLDLAGYSPVIQISDGTFSAGVDVTKPLVGGATLYLRGNLATPANVLISVTNGHCVLNRVAGVTVDVGGLEFRTATAGNCLWAWKGSEIDLGATCRFGVCAGDHFLASEGGFINITQNYTISGNTVNHWHTYGYGEIICQNKTITLSGTPAISGNFAGCAQGAQYVSGNTFSGSATGSRYLSHKLGLIDTGGGGATYLPGNVAGTTATGGQYV